MVFPAMPGLGLTDAIAGAVTGAAGLIPENKEDYNSDAFNDPFSALQQIQQNQNQLSSNDSLAGFQSYLEGLFSSIGEENKLNRDYNSAEAAFNRDFQSAEAQKQRDWYEAMSNSAYQRAVADMEAAGINPILAFSQGGAASAGTGIGAGSAASYNVSSGDTLSSVLSAVAQVITSVSGASANKFDKAYKMLKMFM